MSGVCEVVEGENIPICISDFKDDHGSVGSQQQQSHGATQIHSNVEALEAVDTSSTSIQPAAFSGCESLEVLVSDKPGNTLHVDEENLGEEPNKERRKKEKRKKHRPKVVEVEKSERKSKMEIPIPHQIPNGNTPGKKKDKVIRRRTFSRKKTVANSQEDGDEWEEADDEPHASADEAIKASNRTMMDADELDAEMYVDYCKSEQTEENLLIGSTNISADVNIEVVELLQELAKLPRKSFWPLLNKADVLQLNLESPFDMLKYIVDTIKIPCLLYSFNQARRSMASNSSKWGQKRQKVLDHSAYKVLEKFMYVLKKFLPSILLKYDLRASEHMPNNWNGGKAKRNVKAKRTSISRANSNSQIVPYPYFHEVNSRFQSIEASLTTSMICKHTINGQIARNWEPSQGSNITMQLDLEDVISKFESMDINKSCRLDAQAEPQGALVPSFRGSAVMPYNGAFEQVKQKPYRVDVLLDQETIRLWKLLQDNGGESAEHMDFCKLKWWENERQVFLGRAKSFIARMNLILGDRRFSPWNGSVVDSVVGVFLTQNVSDHLSSSAFMSLAAKFPMETRGQEGGNSVDTMDIEMEVFTDASNKAKENTSNENKINATDGENKDYEGMRRKIYYDSDKKERSYKTMDSINWEAVRSADIKQISDAIRLRGMNNLLAERIMDFLNNLVRDHGSIDLEWLRNICPDEAKKYLLSIRGLGLKSVECVRLLALQNVAFPVDTNVARVSVRLGWVPLKPLPEFLQLHLLEQYPIMDSVQKYIWPRLCKLDYKELYELHYHMITFGKVFCTKSKPNCNICPMKGECKHFNSAKLALPAPEVKLFKSSSIPDTSLSDSIFSPVLQLQYDESSVSCGFNGNIDPIIEYPPSPIIEDPPPVLPHETVQIIREPLHSPPVETIQILDTDMEDAFCEGNVISALKLNLEQFEEDSQNLMQESNKKTYDNDVSKALIELSAEAATIPIRKLKDITGLRTEHLVYELPDSHALLKEMDQREPDDPSPYLIAIWTPGETAQSSEPPESCSIMQETCRLCDLEACFACNNRRELEAQTVRGTFLIPCRTALKGRFPLNGTYFQINEVFADHGSSRTPIHIPRSLLWKLPRRTVYFGTSVAAIFRGFITSEPIQYCFSRGFVCMRGFDRITREPKPLYARLHLPKSKSPNKKKPSEKREEYNNAH